MLRVGHRRFVSKTPKRVCIWIVNCKDLCRSLAIMSIWNLDRTFQELRGRDGGELQHGCSGVASQSCRFEATELFSLFEAVSQAFRRRGDTEEKRKRYDWLPWEAGRSALWKSAGEMFVIQITVNKVMSLTNRVWQRWCTSFRLREMSLCPSSSPLDLVQQHHGVIAQQVQRAV